MFRLPYIYVSWSPPVTTIPASLPIRCTIVAPSVATPEAVMRPQSTFHAANGEKT